MDDEADAFCHALNPAAVQRDGDSFFSSYPWYTFPPYPLKLKTHLRFKPNRTFKLLSRLRKRVMKLVSYCAADGKPWRNLVCSARFSFSIRVTIARSKSPACFLP